MDSFENWIFEILTQYMCSPGWNLPIQNFIDEYCEHFEDNEENKLIYTEIFENFKNLIEEMLQQISSDLEISEGIMVGVLFEALRSKKVSKYFTFILATQEFLFFKRLMVNRNIEIELASIQEAENSINAQQEEEDLRLALSLSLIYQEELESTRFERVLQEDEELKKALELSSLEYIEQINKEKAKLLEEINKFSEDFQKKQQEKNLALENHQKENLQLIRKEAEDMKNRIDQENNKKIEELGNIQKLQQKKKEILEARAKIEALKKEEEKKLISKKIERKKLEDQINSLKIPEKDLESLDLNDKKLEEEEEGESLEARKNRLKVQREIVKQKMREARERELNSHLEKGGIDFSRPAEKLSLAEYEKRKRILEKLKKSNNLPFNNP